MKDFSSVILRCFRARDEWVATAEEIDGMSLGEIGVVVREVAAEDLRAAVALAVDVDMDETTSSFLVERVLSQQSTKDYQFFANSLVTAWGRERLIGALSEAAERHNPKNANMLRYWIAASLDA